MSPGQTAGPPVRQLPLLGSLVLVWILLWGTWSWANVITGCIVALTITWLLPLPPITEHAHLRPLATLIFIARFLTDLAVSSVLVAWVAIRPGGPVRSAIIEVQLHVDSDLLLTLIAETLTLVPGSVVLDVDRGRSVLLMHVLPARDHAEVERHRAGVLAVEQRVVRAFGGARDIAALRDSPEAARPHRSGGRQA